MKTFRKVMVAAFTLAVVTGSANAIYHDCYYAYDIPIPIYVSESKDLEYCYYDYECGYGDVEFCLNKHGDKVKIEVDGWVPNYANKRIHEKNNYYADQLAYEIAYYDFYSYIDIRRSVLTIRRNGKFSYTAWADVYDYYNDVE